MWESVAQASPVEVLLLLGGGGAGGCRRGAVEISFLALGPQMEVGLNSCWPVGEFLSPGVL